MISQLALPAVVLTDPKFPENLGQVRRALSCFGVTQLLYTGERVKRALEIMDRIPRELRMRQYNSVSIEHWTSGGDPLARFPEGAVPVAVEFRDNAEELYDFVHPEKAVYVFGPEDGSVEQRFLKQCHRFVRIPTAHSMNLAAAVHTVLYDRELKRRRA